MNNLHIYLGHFSVLVESIDQKRMWYERKSFNISNQYEQKSTLPNLSNLEDLNSYQVAALIST